MVLWTIADGASESAVAADTWGISGPDFIRVYLVAALAATVIGLVWRVITIRSARGPTDPALTPVEAALLVDDRRPVLAGLAVLRERQLIDSGGEPLRTPSDAEYGELDPVSRTLLTHLGSSPKRHVTELGLAVWNIRVDTCVPSSAVAAS
ncbi:hypothetical protein [Nocardia sp. NPDC020380]|uniref:hypothetical protein n=1 Tax=Nocardia sp. NPDC020380 TaxID=3364309 RepID=UPI0037A54484